MKVTAGKAESTLANPPGAVRAFLLYGPDGGLVAARAKRLVAQIVPDSSDPFNLVRLDPEDLRATKGRLSDELTATTLMGGQRAINCKGFGERERADVEGALIAAEGGDNRLIVSAGDLAGGSKLRKLFESREDCLAVPCYGDEGRSLTDVIRETLGKAGLEAERDALSALTAALGADRSQSVSELEKLITYMGGPFEGARRPVRAADVAAVIADAAPLQLDAYLYAVTGGDGRAADAALARLLADGQAPIRLHNALTTHMTRFATVLTAGGSVETAAGSLRPPLFWKVKDRFLSQAQRMGEARALRAVKDLAAAGSDLRVGALPPALILSRLTLRLCHIFGR